MLTGIDTNVLLRALLDDDREQSALARGFLSELTEDRKGYVSALVTLEVFWVLRTRYRLPRAELFGTLWDLLQVKCLVFEDFDILARSLKLCEAGQVDFSDAVIAELHREKGCVQTVTFDQSAAKLIPSMHLLA